MAAKVSPDSLNDTNNDLAALKLEKLTQEMINEMIDAYMKRKFCEDVDIAANFGGTAYFMDELGVTAKTGLSNMEDHADRIEKYGTNRRPPIIRKTFCELCLEAMKDLTMQILSVCGIISLILGVTLDEHPEIGWIEGFAIMVAVAIVILVTGTNDYAKQNKFIQLQEQNKNRMQITRIRDGERQSVHPEELLCGDIVELANGILIPADGLMIEGNEIEIVEAAMTGENDPIKKQTNEVCQSRKDEVVKESPEILAQVGKKQELEALKIERGGQDPEIEKQMADLPDHHHEIPSPIVLSGTTLSEGQGLMVVIAVGSNSAEGRIVEAVEQEEETTPLQDKLEKLAGDIGKLGLIAAVITMLILYIRFIIEISIGALDWDSGHPIELVRYFVLGITVLVVAIPEGLPLAVTISLAYSVQKMQQDNNLVRRLHACETMGGANMICSDKTGTLTQNKMSVAQFFMNGTHMDFEATPPTTQTFSPEFFAILKETSCVNSTAYFVPEEGKEDKEIGSKTELAIILLLLNLGHSDYQEVRKDVLSRENRLFAFSSKRKRSSIVITPADNSGKRVHVKGASEVVLARCTQYLDEQGNPKPLTDQIRQDAIHDIDDMANKALRTIGIAYRDLPSGFDIEGTDEAGEPLVESNDLVLIGITGIKDPIRPEVPKAVSKCKTAGIKVRMVTGDNVATARAIAKECGIITTDKSLVMEGSEFAALTGGLVCAKCLIAICDCPKTESTAKKGETVREDVVANFQEFENIIGRLEVLARSRPDDKLTLVTGLKQQGNVVAVTGDGTNDAPALKKADIGFAMGIQGTDMAKEAADIMLLDDNFKSIVKAVMWGRNIYDNIRRFLIFQLTVNVVAVTVAIVGAAILKQSPLTAVQMLWVNLIMDTFASLALATEPPSKDHLKRKPHRRTEYIVSPIMWKHLFGQAVFQIAIVFVMMFAGEWFLPEYGSGERVKENPDDDRFVISGRLKEIDGAGDDYQEDYDDPDIGPSRHFTYIFNSFVLLQLFNEINSRKIRNELNVFEGIFKAPLFIIIWIGTVAVQIVIVSGGGYALSCHLDGLTWEQWLICIGIGASCLLWRLPILLIPDKICMFGAGKPTIVEPEEAHGESLALAMRRTSFDGSKKHSSFQSHGSNASKK